MEKLFLFLFAAAVLAGCADNNPQGQNPANDNQLEPIANAPIENDSRKPSRVEETVAENLQASIIENADVRGEISENQTWRGTIHVVEHVFVPEGVTLTIEPGTRVKFKHNREYKNALKTGLELAGTLKAIGIAEKPIFFTSDANIPQNGDWSMIRLFGKTKSEIRYAVIEFGLQGVNMWKSDAVISHSIVRWNNWEGLYAESYSTPIIEYNRVYQNGYNGMAMEQFNDAVVQNNLFEKSGTHGLHIDASKAAVENNIFRENGASGLSLDNKSTVNAVNNTSEKNRLHAVMCGEGDNRFTGTGNKWQSDGEITNCSSEVFLKNDLGEGADEIGFGFEDIKSFDLGYTPGDQKKDRYAYAYPDDETRHIVKKMGKGLGLTWSIALEGKYVWTSSVSGDIYKMDKDSGEILQTFNATSPQPWGMTFANGQLWVTDFAEKRTYALDPKNGDELFSFNNPDQERGAKGLASDGKNLYLMGWTTNTIYKMDFAGNVLHEIKLDYGAGGGIAFDGKTFWVPCDVICRFSTDGKLIGKIYPASEGTWDLEWEPSANAFGGYLWATQRTNENWQDEKIYQLEIRNDQLALMNNAG